MFSVLNMQFLYMNDPKVLKEFSTYTSSNIGKSPLIMEMFDPPKALPTGMGKFGLAKGKSSLLNFLWIRSR